MSKSINRATITVDEVARLYFPESTRLAKKEAAIFADLQEHLQDKGDDPRYSRVIFAVENKKNFVESDEGHVALAGVFPRYLHNRFAYGNENRLLRSVMSVCICDTLVVADSEPMAELWEKELDDLGYQVRRI